MIVRQTLARARSSCHSMQLPKVDSCRCGFRRRHRRNNEKLSSSGNRRTISYNNRLQQMKMEQGRTNYSVCRRRVVGIMTSAAVATAILALATLSFTSTSAASSASAFLAATPTLHSRNGIIPPSASLSSKLNLYCNRNSGINSLQWTKPISTLSSFGSQRLKKNAPRTICYYTDEWLDAEIELAAFNLPRRHRHNSQSRRERRRRRGHFQSNKVKHPLSSSSYSFSKSSPKVFLLRQVFFSIIKFYLQLKETIRTKLERSTVYVLECENNKYYVGSTTNRKRRYYQHMHRKGSKWTKVHRPISLLKEYRRIPSIYLLGMESKVTAQTMLRYGVNNVRGSMFCSVRNYHLGDIDALTKFLGHYNDLEYGRVYSKLCRMLPPPPSAAAASSSSQVAMEGVDVRGGERRKGGKQWRKSNAENVIVVLSGEEDEQEETANATETAP